MKHKRVSLSDVDGFVRDEIFGDDSESGSGLRLKLLRQVLTESTTVKQRRYIKMYYKDGLTMDEIADRCGVAKSTVSRTIARGRSRILSGLRSDELKRLMDSSQGEE